MSEIRWQRVNDEPFEYAIQQGPHGDEFIKLLDGSCLRRTPCVDAADEIARFRVDNERLREALKPFAEIGLDVLKNNPGWANRAFHGLWSGYRLTYVQFEAAAAASISVALNEQSAPSANEKGPANPQGSAEKSGG